MNALGRNALALGAGAALALCSGGAGLAQTTQAAPDSTQSAHAPAQNAPQQQAPRTLKMVQAQAQLDKTIDAKKAKQGDPVMAKLVADVQIPDSQELPKNTELEGHVDQVTASDHKSDSTMVLTFDKAKLKDGQEVPIKATILAMAEPAMATDAGGGGGAPGGGMASGGAPSGGGGMSGGGGARSGGGGSSASPGPTAQQAPSMGDSGGGASQPSQAQGVPDVTLTSNIHQHNSATLTSKGRNVHVPDGTQMEVAIGIIPAGVQVQ
jgi:hypothetical protein